MPAPLSLLIGFEYHDLNGTLIDLYHAYKWCQTFDCEIHVITDIKDFSIKQGVADPDLETFYDRCTSKYIVSNKAQLIAGLDTILRKPSSKLIIYYTGHGLKNGIELPDHSLMSFNDFRDQILKDIEPEVEIFWILDCCNPDGLSLPYQLKNNQFIFNSGDHHYYGPHRILLITSANPHEKSVATKMGSLFTRYLFQILSKMLVTNFDPQKPLPLIHNRNLQRLIGNLSSAIRTAHSGYQQTVSIYTSYIQDPVLWMWIGSTKPYDISTTDSTIIIHRT